MRLETFGRAVVVFSTSVLLSGCLNTADYRQPDKTHKINQLTNENRQLQRQISDLTANKGQLANDNAQLKTDNSQLKQRLMIAVQTLDKFRKKIIADVNNLADDSGLLESVGNEIVERPATLPIANRQKPLLLVNTEDQLAPYFVVRRFAGFFQMPTQVQLWLLDYQSGSDTYQVTFRSKTFEAGRGDERFELERWQAASYGGSVYGFYFPNGNGAVAYHPTSNVNDGARFSKNKKLDNLTIGQSIKLDSSRDLQGVKISWGVMGLRQ